MNKLHSLLNYFQKNFGFDFSLYSKIKDDVCYLYASLDIPLIGYGKQLKVFSYITDDYHELNDEKMYDKLKLLLPSNNELFNDQLGTIERVINIRNNMFNAIKDMDDAENFKMHDEQNEWVEGVNKYNILPENALREIVKVFDGIK